MAHRILHLAMTTRGSCDACALRARRDYKLASREFHAVMEMWGSFLTRGYAKRRNGFLLGLRYANVSLAHLGVESS